VDDSARLRTLAQTLREASCGVSRDSISGREALVARRSDFRWTWVASRLHTFVITFTVAGLTPSDADRLVAAAQRYAIDHKPGLPRGLQTVLSPLPRFSPMTLRKTYGRGSETSLSTSTLRFDFRFWQTSSPTD